MPGLYVRDAGGVSRKYRELHEAQDGVDRKLREMYARDTGAVSRKVFSGYDCHMSIYSTDSIVDITRWETGEVRFVFNGVISERRIMLRYVFDKPIDFTRGGSGLDLYRTIFNDGHDDYNFPLGAWLSATTDTYDGISRLMIEDKDSGKDLHILSNQTGSSNAFYLEIKSGYNTSKAVLYWSGISICGTRPTNIELV